MAARKQIIDLPEALRRLEFAKALAVRSVAVTSLWHGALARAHEAGISAYDTLFVELAERESVPLATFDEQVLESFPRLARRPRAVPRKS
jgi:predicted nucleic acid-binding protein